MRPNSTECGRGGSARRTPSENSHARPKQASSRPSSVRAHAARQGRQVVAALQAGHDAALRVARGHGHDLLGDPGVIGLDQAQLAQIVVTVRIEAGRNEDHFGRKARQRGQPHRLDHLAHRRAARVGGHRHVDHVLSLGRATAVRVERVLEQADHQHPVVAGNDVLGAVAVVHVEINNRHPFETVHIERMAGSDGHIVEKAKAHRRVAGGVVAGRADGTKRIARLAVDDQIGRRHRCTCRMQGCLIGVAAGAGIGIHRAGLAVGRAGLQQLGDFADIAVRVGQLDGAPGHRPGLVPRQCHIEPVADQPVFNRVEPLRALGVAFTHLV